MSTATVSSPPNASASAPRILDTIYRSVETALADLCRRRHETEVTVNRCVRNSLNQPTRLRLRCNDHITMNAQIRVRHVGGNVYDVRCSIEDGPSRQFTYSRPDRGAAALSRAPELGRKLGAFLLNELERKIGRHHLSNQ